MLARNTVWQCPTLFWERGQWLVDVIDWTADPDLAYTPRTWIEEKYPSMQKGVLESMDADALAVRRRFVDHELDIVRKLHAAGGADDEVRAAGGGVAERDDRLPRLAEAHVVGEDRAAAAEQEGDAFNLMRKEAIAERDGLPVGAVERRALPGSYEALKVKKTRRLRSRGLFSAT